MLKRTCGILCSDTSIFEVLLFHINNFFSFTFRNVWWREFDFSIYLFKFLYVRPQFIRSTMTIRLCIFRKILCFSISFREIFALFFSRNFRIIFSQNRLKQNFAKNAKFSRNGFSFSLETLVRSKALYGNKIFSKKVSLYS